VRGEPERAGNALDAGLHCAAIFGLGAWNRDPDHIQKAFLFGGMNARSGVTSALVVKAGWTGVDDIYSGKDNFFRPITRMPTPPA